MKLALTVWDGRISPVFDVCQEALILGIEGKTVRSSSSASIDAADPVHKIGRLVELEIDTLICGAISEPLQRELIARGVRVLGFVAGEIDEVVPAFIAGTLPSPALAMPGCTGRRQRSGRGRGQGGGRRQRGPQVR